MNNAVAFGGGRIMGDFFLPFEISVMFKLSM